MSYMFGALGGTRTPTILLTATSRQRVYQFRHERLLGSIPDRCRTGSTARDVTNRGCRDKACQRVFSQCFGRLRQGKTSLADAGQPRQHLLDFDRDPVAIDKHHAAGDRQVVGEDPDLVRLGRIQLDDGATAEAHYLMAVSYTHLRAHETGRNLVCRLLLEKKK